MKIISKAFYGISLGIILIFVQSCTGCAGGSSNGDFQSFYSNEVPDQEMIEAYHLSHFPVSFVENPNDKLAIYVDLSDGITKYSFGNKNNIDVYEMLFKVAAAEPTAEYYELSDDKVTLYNDGEANNYFTGKGFKKDGRLKQGAPIDQAINAIVDRDNVGVLITDGELFNIKQNVVSSNTWASTAFEKWMNKGNKLVIIYTDFEEENDGETYDKHMYVMFFIPNKNNESLDKKANELLNNYINDLEEEGYKTKKLEFSTNTNGLYRRDYPNSQLPGSSTYIEYFDKPLEYYVSEKSAIEFVDMTPAAFNCEDEGLVYYLRDLGDPNTGKPQNYPLFEKLYFNFSALTSYNVEDLKIVIHEVSDDFKNYKRNVLARKNLPVLESSMDGTDSLDEDNFLVFSGMSLVDDAEPYDISKATVEDTVDGFLPILKSEFKFKKTDFKTTDIGIQDFIELDKSAGRINEINQSGEYEILLKFSEKLNENNNNFNSDRDNLFRIDIVLEEVESKEIDKAALTWDKIDKSGEDDALYRSLKNIMEKEEVKPKGVIYSFYVKLAPFNQ